MSTKTFQATDENMQHVFDFIHENVPADCPAAVLNKIDLAVEEIFVNIAHYAYAPDTGNVTISCEIADGTMTVVFSDSGKKFDPLDRDDPDTSIPLEERNIGGLGIFLTKQFMDSVSYEYAGNQNKLTIQKRLS